MKPLTKAIPTMSLASGLLTGVAIALLILNATLSAAQGAEPKMDGALVAQTGEQQQMQQSDQPMEGDAEKMAPGGKTALSEQKLVGMKVRTMDGKSLGEIEQAVMSGTNVDAVLVDVGGFLGIGEKRVAIPAEDISVEGDELMVDMTEDEIEQLPEYQE